ncbi:MAG: ATP synthase F1 subunit epsilon [Halobacteriovoraceae bacterium]|nr:ATP synthase F1 subunit epsilon [Halobacteriovoraceae bacterium]
MSAFSLDILTPNGVVVKDLPCEELFIPTYEGEINVLKNHTHILTQLSTGVMMVVEPGGHNHYFHVTSGVCKILGGKVSVLSTTTETAKQIDTERAQKALQVAKHKLANETLSEDEHEKYQRKLKRAESRIKISSLKK